MKNILLLKSIKFDLFLTNHPLLIKELTLKGYFRFNQNLWIKKSGGRDSFKSLIKLVQLYDNSLFFQIKFKDMIHNKHLATFIDSNKIYHNLVII